MAKRPTQIPLFDVGSPSMLDPFNQIHRLSFCSMRSENLRREIDEVLRRQAGPCKFPPDAGGNLDDRPQRDPTITTSMVFKFVKNSFWKQDIGL